MTKKVNIVFAFIAIFAMCAVLAGTDSSNAAVTALDAWTNIHSSAPNNTGGTINAGSLTVSSGTNRLFLAAVCLEQSANYYIQTLNVSLGGTALTEIRRTNSFTSEHCYLGYLKESQIQAGSNSLSVSYQTYFGYNVTGIHVKWASYSGVNQVIPINDSNAYTGTTSVTFGAQIDYIADGLTLYIAANNGTPATMSPPSDFSQIGSSTTTHWHSSFMAATANHGSNGNYASGTTVNFEGTTSDRSALVVAALNPPATVVGNGTNPSNTIICPGDGATELDAFTLQTSSGTDTVTGVTVTLSTGMHERLSLVEITSDDGATVYGSVTDPSSDTVSIILDTNIEATATETQYKVRITPKSHADMPDPPGGNYIVTGTVTEITSTGTKIYSDSGSASITIDNWSPGTQTLSGIPGDEEVVLSWSTAFGGAVEYVLLRNTSEIADAPVEGDDYIQGNTIGTSSVVYVGSDLTFTDTGLTNGVNYYYKIFAKDSCGNYSVGSTPPSPYYFTPGPVVTLSSSGTQTVTMDGGSTGNYIGAAFTFQQSSETAGTDITALTISEKGTAIANTELTNVKVYYENDVSSCSYDGTEASIDTSFNSSEQIVLSSVSIPVTVSPNVTCVYVVFDVDSSALNNTTVDLEITSSDDFTLSGSVNKDGSQSYPVALSGTTTLRSETTNFVKVGSFQSGTSTGYVNVTGVGFQPKAVIFFWTRQSSTGFSSASAMSIGEGFAVDSPIVNRSITGICFDDENPTICGRRRSETYSIMFFKDDAGAPLSGQGQVTSFNPDGFTIYWNSAPGIDTYVNYIALSGDDNFDARAGTITASTSSGNQAFTEVGFKPDFVMFLASSNESLNTNVNHLYFNTGFMTASGQAAVSVRGRNNQTSTGHSTSQQSTNQAIMGLLLNGTQDWLASYVSMDDDGFTLNFSDPPASNMPIFYLALKGGMYKTGTFNQPSSGTAPFTTDYPVGFQPLGLFMASANRYISWLQGQIVPEGEISIGAATSSTERAAIWGETRDITPPSDANMSVMTDKVIRFATGAGTGTPTIDAEADFDSFLPDGFRLNWTTLNDTTQRTVVYWAIGNAVTTVGNGTDPSGTTLCPGDGAAVLDAFTLKTSAGSDTVTSVTVTLEDWWGFNDYDYYEAVSLVEITDDSETTVYGSVSDPTSDDIFISLDTDIPVTTTQTQYRVRITPKSHADMPVPPGLLYRVKVKVTGITCINTKSYNDSSNLITIDNNSPVSPSGFSGTPGDGQVELTWTNSGGTDGVVILRNTSSFTDKPVEGEHYVENDTIGTSTVIYAGSGTTHTDTGLAGGETYYYRIFAKDSCGNYSADGAETAFTNTTASSSGTQTATMEAGSTGNYVGAAFTFQQSSGTNTITTLTISETGDADANSELTNVKVYYENDVSSCSYDGNEEYIGTSFNSSDKIALSSVSIPVSIKPNFTCIYVVFDVDLLAVHDRTVALEITSSNDLTLSGSSIKSGSYPVVLGSTTLQDTIAPDEITGLTVVPNDGQITFSWTNPTDADFEGVRISRTTGGTPPADCSTGTDIAAPDTSYTDTGLTNLQQYSYRFCTYDEVPNYSGGVTASETPPQVPLLSYPAAPYDDGKHPDTGDTTTGFTFKLLYTDLENDAPASGYPRIYIGDNDGYYGYTMSLDTSADASLKDGDYTNGEQYVYGPVGFGAAEDLRFYFEAMAASGLQTIVKLPSDAPTGYSTGPSVYLLKYNNMVGVPKDLGETGLPYAQVLQDDSGAKYCIFWDSYGLDTGSWQGSWQYCINGNIEKGKGYFIWSMADSTYRLDEPDGVGNVTDPSVDIELDPEGGWTMISNPYNVNIELQDVKVMRYGDATEYTFIEAVTNGWIDNAIFEYEGSVTGYTFKAFNGSPPAVLEPWVGFFIYVKDTAAPITLRVYKPLQ